MLGGISAVTSAMTQLKGDGPLGEGASLIGAQAPTTPFSGLVADAVQQVNALENQARITVDGLMTGSKVDVHQAIIATQKADMAFELALSIRNKAVQAYQSVMGMQF